MVVESLSRVRLFATPCTVAHQAAPSMGFSRQQHEWVAISFSRRSSSPRDRTRVSRIVDRRFTVWATREAHMSWIDCLKRWSLNERVSHGTVQCEFFFFFFFLFFLFVVNFVIHWNKTAMGSVWVLDHQNQMWIKNGLGQSFSILQEEKIVKIIYTKAKIKRQSVDHFKARVVNIGYYREHGT